MSNKRNTVMLNTAIEELVCAVNHIQLWEKESLLTPEVIFPFPSVIDDI